MNGLRGLPCSASSWTSELKALPDGSRPTRCQSSSPSSRNAIVQANSLEILWMEKRVSAAPVRNTSPEAVTIAMPKLSAGTFASSGM